MRFPLIISTSEAWLKVGRMLASKSTAAHDRTQDTICDRRRRGSDLRPGERRIQSGAFLIDRDRIDPGKVREMLRNGKYLLAEDDGALIACVYVELRGQRAYFGLLGVDPMRQGQGLGRKERWWRKRRTTRERPAASSWICGSSISAANCRHFIGAWAM
jgi:hypothetical protein